jgi:putative membrane protein
MTDDVARADRRDATGWMRRLMPYLVPTGVAVLAILGAERVLAGHAWLKALHVVAILSWMAGLLYLPRLFVYHTGTATGSEASETFKLMEYRLHAFIMRPAAIVSWMIGLWLAWASFGFAGGWLHAKLALAVALTGAHGYFAAAVKAFARDERRHAARHWRIWNEVPTLLMVAIVVLVIVKPL